MLESLSERLCEPGGVHYGSPDKRPEARLETLRLAGELRVPFTTGILIGIGETRAERLEALFAIRDLHRRFGHVQEVIVQNFRAKPGTKLRRRRGARSRRPALEHRRRPPDPGPGDEYPGAAQPVAGRLSAPDRGGDQRLGRRSLRSRPDHVNPEAPWPAIAELAERTAAAGKLLVHRLPIYPVLRRATSRPGRRRRSPSRCAV